ncbi:MAG: amino acid ABC transporter substrate-binding protein [Cardiobacteriaceae bacterium]|nr:amino acid ABC transporter substrate-binding protein [Cardiobacteriaceae bacterium]
MIKPILYTLLTTLTLQSALANSRLDTIKENQVIKIGYSDSKFPFTYHSKNQEPTGFDMALMEEIAAHLAKSLNLSNLRLEPVLITNSNRFQKIADGEIDLSCASHSNTIERKKIVQFSNNYFQTRVRLMVKKDSNIDSYKALEGKKVAVAKGTQAETLVQHKSRQFKFSDVLSTSGRQENMDLLNRGEVDGIFDDDILLLGLNALTQQHDDFDFVGPAISIDNYACILPKDDKEFKELVDRGLAQLFMSDRIQELYNQWFLQPIQTPDGKEVSLNFEMNSGITSLYRTPNDRAIGE